jgi:hypothetical protein
MKDMEYKYYCEKCKFGCHYESGWKAHEISNKHRGCENKEYKLEPKKCDQCYYKTLCGSNLKLHILNHHSTKEERKKAFTHYCEECDYGIFGKKQFERHLEIKHK